MNRTRNARYIVLALGLVALLAFGALTGCTTPAKPTASADTSTAKGALTVAMSTLSTAAPDGKLLVGQSAQAMTATSTPAWNFLIGSPKTDKIYAVAVMGGKGQFQEYGPAGLSAAEWNMVPPTSDWKIDSNVAHEKAVVVHPAGKDASYILGFVTYIPKSATGTKTQPMKWFVAFDPKVQGKAPTSTVDVDMVTGAAAYAK